MGGRPFQIYIGAVRAMSFFFSLAFLLYSKTGVAVTSLGVSTKLLYVGPG